MATVTPMIEPDADAMRAHLEHVFGGDLGGAHDGRIEIAWTDAADGKLRHGAAFGTDQIEEAIDHAVAVNRVPNRNVYFGAALRHPHTAPFGRAADADFYALPALYVDLDDDVLAAARDHYRHRGCPPTAVVVTGRQPHVRAQLIWRLDEPERDPKATRAQLRALADALGGDVTVVNPARVLRLAGSIAWPVKPGRVLERTEWQQPDDGRPRAYQWGQIAQAFAPTKPNNQPEFPPKVGSIPQGTGADIKSETLGPAGGLHLDLGVRIEQVMADARAGKQWHNNVLRMVANWISRGWSDAEIIGQAAGLTLSGYTIAQTIADMRAMIDGARTKWNTPNPTQTIDGAGEQAQPEKLRATRFSGVNATRVPKRRWLYGHHLIRGYVSTTVSPGGIGKTTLTLTDAVALATGRTILADTPHEPAGVAVWHYNLEDPLDELDRRVIAICARYNVTDAELGGRLYLDSGRSRRLIVAARNRNGDIVATPDVEAVIEEIRANNIACLSIDPFVRSHYGEENDNRQIDDVLAIYGRIANETGCAIDLVHHVRKPPGTDNSTPGDINQARGAGALAAAVRSARTVAEMTKTEAEGFGIEENKRRWFVRVDDAKGNMHAPAANATWYTRESIDIKNSTIGPGDHVGVLVPWTRPDPFFGLSISTARSILIEIDQGPTPGERYTGHASGRERWAGRVIQQHGGKSESDAAQILKTWLAEGVLWADDYHSPEVRKPRKGLFLDRKKLPTTDHELQP